jgi:4-hydroxybenzoate polyprenyltransferase
MHGKPKAAQYSRLRYPPFIRITRVIRAGEWWEFKLVPILALFYGTALLLHTPIASLWPALVMVLLALAPGAAYVSVINDMTDREDDLVAGKSNQFATRSRAYGGVLVAITVGAGLVICFLLRRDMLLLTVYLLAWLSFSLYSLPPFRWKNRGAAGVVCDAAGAQLFPSLVAVILAFRQAAQPPDMIWLAATATWALAHGLRGILWHQLSDAENDRRAGAKTLVQRHRPEVIVALGTFVAFPIELGALALILWKLGSSLALALLVVYAGSVFYRMRWWRLNAVVVAPKPRYLIVLDEYYIVHFPLALLIASSLANPRDLIVLASHLLLFPVSSVRVVKELVKLVRERQNPT